MFVPKAVPFPAWMPLSLMVIQLWDLNRLHLHLEVGADPMRFVLPITKYMKQYRHL